MDISKQIEQVRSKLTDEQLSTVGSVLKEIESGFLELSNDLSAANSESKARKLKIRDLEKEKEDHEVKITELQGKIDSFDNEPLIKERDQYKIKYSNILNAQKQSFVTQFTKIQEHPNFEKAKSKFNIPDIKEIDGKQVIDWDGLTEEQLEKNITVLNDLNSLEYFGQIAAGDVDYSKGATNLNQIDKIKNAKTHDDLVQLRPKELTY